MPSLADAFAALPAWDDEERADRLAAVRRDFLRRARRAATVPVKTCPRCEEKLPAKAFSENTAQPDGLSPWCRSCDAARSRAARARRLHNPTMSSPTSL